MDRGSIHLNDCVSFRNTLDSLYENIRNEVGLAVLLELRYGHLEQIHTDARWVESHVPVP